MSTQIKRLLQNNVEFVPITLAEAVVVNTDGLNLISNLQITTLDKVLREILNISGDSISDIETLTNAVNTINNTLQNKQDKLTAGVGIKIENGIITATSITTLYKIVEFLPQPSEECLNSIYLIPVTSPTSGNYFKEIICFEKNGAYVWEEIGTVQTDVDLTGYITRQEYTTKIEEITTALNSKLTAISVTTSNGSSQVVVNYNIPSDLYDNI